MRIAPECWPIAVPLGVLAGLGFFIWVPAGVALLAPLLFTLWFFRDPERTTPADPSLLISPADGRIIVSRPGRVSVFMNVFNVHVCRAPAAGRVTMVRHTPGRFVAAFREDAPEANERVRIELERSAAEPLAFTLIAGLVARRIVPRVSPGDRLRAGERVGLIRFGSRVDLELPEGTEPAVHVGDRVRAGETPLARVVVGATPAPEALERRPAGASVGGP